MLAVIGVHCEVLVMCGRKVYVQWSALHVLYMVECATASAVLRGRAARCFGTCVYVWHVRHVWHAYVRHVCICVACVAYVRHVWHAYVRHGDRWDPHAESIVLIAMLKG